MLRLRQIRAVKCVIVAAAVAFVFLPPALMAADLVPLKLQDLAQWDRFTREYDQRISMLRALGARVGPNSAGRTVLDDLDLPQPLTARHDALVLLRTQADAQTRAGDQVALRQTLDEAAALMVKEVFRIGIVGSFWGAQAALKYHQSLLQPLLAFAAESDRAATTEIMTASRAAAEKFLSDALNADSLAQMQAQAAAFKGALFAPFRIYNDERQRLAEQLDVTTLLPAEKRTRSTAGLSCSKSAPPTSGAPVPRAVRVPSLADYYPAASRRAIIEGRVVVKIAVSAAGCLTSVEVRRSSGAPELDAAALQWVTEATFLPAVKDHQPVDGSTQMAVRFKLTDAPQRN